MGFLEVLKKKVPAELFTQIETALGEDFDDDFIPRSRLTKVIHERNDLREQIKSATSTDDDGGEQPPKTVVQKETVKLLTQADLDTAIKAVKEQALQESLTVEKKSAVLEKLREAKVREPALLIPQLNMDLVKKNEAGEWTGIAEQVTPWQTKAPYIFSDYVPSGTGAGGKELPKSDRATLVQQQADAVKAGNIALSVALKRQIIELKE